MSWLTDYQKEHKRVLDSVSDVPFNALVKEIMDALKRGSKIFCIGNGGSAANASHFIEDLGKGAGDAVTQGHFCKVTGAKYPGFQAVDLTSSVPYITAIGNDYCFEDIYLRQLKTLAREGDVLIGLSVSGTSKNLVRAFKYAGKAGLRCIGITGKSGAKKPQSIYAYGHLSIAFDSDHFGIVEDCTMTLMHQICYYIMDQFA